MRGRTVAVVAAQVADELLRGRRRGDAELAAQAIGERAVEDERRRAIAALGQARDETAVGLLAVGVDGDLPAGPEQRALVVADAVGARGEALEDREQPFVVLFARADHPLVVEAGEQRTAAQLDGRLQLAGVDEARELGGIDPDPLVGETDAVAVGDEQAVGGRPELAAQCPHRAAQAPRELASSTSGQKQAARSPRACRPGCRAR